MPGTMTIAKTVTPEATAYVAELGMQAALDEMLRRAGEIIPGVHTLKVTLQPPYDTGSYGVIIDAISDDPVVARTPVEREWRQWRIETYPPEIWSHFTLFAHYLPNAR